MEPINFNPDDWNADEIFKQADEEERYKIYMEWMEEQEGRIHSNITEKEQYEQIIQSLGLPF